MSKIQIGPKPFLMPQPAVLVGTMVDGRANFMVAAWCGMANHLPPMLSVAVRPARHTEVGIRANKTFSICTVSVEMAAKADYCGIVSGAREDKSEVFATSCGELKGAPLIDESPLILECRLVQTIELPTHHLHIGEVIQTHVDERCMGDKGPDMGKVDPLIFSMSDSKYWQLGEEVGRAFKMGKEYIA